ncbi:MAG TPA: TIR domain-containing protein, partial [Saprospiraceae bacterium]|nr:TIR domain-containing protein [Saprospiraceae bacterium]
MQEIPKALENSDALIVVCSTKSADSKWVNKEIIDFKMMHGEDRIFPIIVDGEPFARESESKDDELECFPEALKYKVDSEGNLTDERTSILASSTIEKEDGQELAKLKLIAGVLGVPFGEFYRRDEEQKRRDRNKNIAIWSFVFVLMVGLILYGQNQRDEVLKTNKKVELIQNSNLIKKGIKYRNNFKLIKAKHLFADAVSNSNKSNEKNTKIAYNSITNEVELKNIFKFSDDIIGIKFFKNKEWVLTWDRNNNINLWSFRTMQFGVLFTLVHDNTIEGVSLNENENKVLSWDKDNKIKLWNVT